MEALAFPESTSSKQSEGKKGRQTTTSGNYPHTLHKHLGTYAISFYIYFIASLSYSFNLVYGSGLEVRGQLYRGIPPLLPLYGKFQGSKSGHQAYVVSAYLLSHLTGSQIPISVQIRKMRHREIVTRVCLAAPSSKPTKPLGIKLE